MNETTLPWDDLRTILAIARSGSLAGAARALGVSHATAFRRLGAIEDRLGVRLFERDRSGYAATPAGEEVAQAASRVESEVLGVERRIAGRDLRPAGSIRVTTTDSLLEGVLAPICAEFLRVHDAIALEVSVSNVLYNLTRREADVALRPTQDPPAHLVGRRIGVIAQAVYGRADRLAGTRPDAAALDWVGPDPSMAYRALESWMAHHRFDARCRMHADSLLGMHAAVRAGIGVTVLPCYLGDADAGLVRMGEPVDELATDLWLLTHPDLRNVARMRAFSDFVAAAVRKRHAVLEGQRARPRT